MPGNRNITPQEKIKAVKEFLSGNGSEYTIAEKYGVSRSGFRRWVLKFFFRLIYNKTQRS